MARREDYDIVLRATDQTQGAFASAQRGAAGLNGAVGMLHRTLGSLGVALSAGAVLNYAKEAVSSLADVGNTAKRVGATTDALQALRFEVKQGGGDFRDADAFLQKFAETASKAGTGGGYMAKVFAANGVALKDGNKQLRTGIDLLQDYARLVLNTAAHEDKLRLAREAGGKGSGAEMLETLEKIARVGLPAVIEESKKLGVVVDKNLIDKADEVDRRWKLSSARLETSLKGGVIKGLEGIDKYLAEGTTLRKLVDMALHQNKIEISVDATPETFNLVDRIWEAAKSGIKIAYGPASYERDFGASFNERHGQMRAPSIDKALVGQIADYLKLADAVHKAGEAFAALGKPTKMPIDNDVLQKQIDSISRHVAVMEADVLTVDASAGAREGLRVRTQLLEVAHQHGIPVVGQYADEIERLAKKAILAGDALAYVRLKSDILFERDQIGRSADEQAIAARLRAAKIDAFSQDGRELSGLMQLNQQLQFTKSLGDDALKGLLADLRQGKTLAEAATNAATKGLAKVQDKLAEAIWNDLWKYALGGGGGGLSILSLLGLGGGSGGGTGLSLTTTGGLYAGGGFTGNRPAEAVAGFVHGKEYVFDAESTAALGVPMLDALRRGARGYKDGGYVGPSWSAPNWSGARADGASKVEFHLHPPAGVESSEKKSRGADGGERIDIYQFAKAAAVEAYGSGDMDAAALARHGSRRVTARR